MSFSLKIDALEEKKIHKQSPDPYHKRKLLREQREKEYQSMNDQNIQNEMAFQRNSNGIEENKNNLIDDTFDKNYSHLNVDKNEHSKSVDEKSSKDIQQNSNTYDSTLAVSATTTTTTTTTTTVNHEISSPSSSSSSLSSSSISNSNSSRGKKGYRGKNSKEGGSKHEAKKKHNCEDNKTILFKTGNPSIDEICGVIHLFKSLNRKKNSQKQINANEGKQQINNKSSDSNGPEGEYEDENSMDMVSELPAERSKMICILAVPSFISVTDFCNFISCFKAKIKKIQIVRDDSPNKYMVLLEFDCIESAESFYLQYNGRPFNSFDPEECKLVFVSHVEIDGYNNGADSIDSDGINNVKENNDTNKKDENVCSPSAVLTTSFQSSSNSAFNSSSIKVELPTCPVCLDRLDSEVSGIITTMCNHGFHCDCLTKWGDGTCPVCRYSHQSTNECQVCGTKENLWICLTCGSVGCGRYNGGHARLHFEKTNHTYSMELETQHVWDYTGDGYVHRLIQSKSDGKLVEISNPNSKKDAQLREAEFQSKLESILNEYNQLLTNQLASQRVYFENLLKKLEKERDMQLESVIKEVSSLKQEKKALLSKIEKQNQVSKKDSEEMEFLNQTLRNNQKQLKELSETQQKKYEKMIAEKDKKIKNLEEEVRDLMMHFETQSKIQSSTKKEEIQNGSLIISPTPSSSNIITSSKIPLSTSPSSKKRNRHKKK